MVNFDNFFLKNICKINNLKKCNIKFKFIKKIKNTNISMKQQKAKCFMMLSDTISTGKQESSNIAHFLSEK